MHYEISTFKKGNGHIMTSMTVRVRAYLPFAILMSHDSVTDAAVRVVNCQARAPRSAPPPLHRVGCGFHLDPQVDLPFQVPTSRPPAPARPVQIRSLSGNVPNVRCRPSAGSRCPPSSAGRGEDEEEEDATQGWQCSGGNSARRTPRARASVIQDSIGIMTNRDARARRRRRHGLCVPGHPGPSLRHSSPLSWH